MAWFKYKHDCKKHGHQYEARYDEVIARFLTSRHEIEMAKIRLELPYEHRYVRDVCVKCGDCVDRLDGNEHPLEILARCAKR